MGPRQRECGLIMIKHIVGTARGVASEARSTIVIIAGNTNVVVVRLRIHMTGNAGKFGKVGRIRMAVNALAPFTKMFATVNREILAIVIKSGRFPCVFCVACRTII